MVIFVAYVDCGIGWPVESTSMDAWSRSDEVYMSCSKAPKLVLLSSRIFKSKAAWASLQNVSVCIPVRR